MIRVDLRSPAFKDDPQPTWARLRALGPVVLTRQPLLGRIALTTTHAAALEVLRDTERFGVDARRAGQARSSGLRWWVPAAYRPLAENLLTLDGAEHRRLRKLVDRAFQARAIKALEPAIVSLCAEQWHSMMRQPSPDLVAHFARPLPQRVITELLGLHDSWGDTQHPMHAALARLSSVSGPLDLFRMVPTIRLIRQQMLLEIDARRAHPGCDLLSALVHSEDGQGGLSDEQLLAMTFLLYVAGHETTTHWLSASFLELLRRPAAWPAFQAQGPSAPLLAELMRFVSPVQLSKPRFVLKTCRLGDVPLERGDTIAALIGAANSDPAWIESPAELCLDRPAQRHLGFGTGPHVCLGMQLAQAEMRATLAQAREASPSLRLVDARGMPAWSRRLGLRALLSLPVTQC